MVSASVSSFDEKANWSIGLMWDQERCHSDSQNQMGLNSHVIKDSFTLNKVTVTSATLSYFHLKNGVVTLPFKTGVCHGGGC